MYGINGQQMASMLPSYRTKWISSSMLLVIALGWFFLKTHGSSHGSFRRTRRR
ncbi:hypothetical protein BDV11DRAFT_200257 [Aspergillus similis]